MDGLIIRPRPGDILDAAGFTRRDRPDLPDVDLPADVLGPLPPYLNLTMVPTGTRGLVEVRIGCGTPLVGMPAEAPNPYKEAWEEARLAWEAELLAGFPEFYNKAQEEGRLNLAVDWAVDQPSYGEWKAQVLGQFPAHPVEYIAFDKIVTPKFTLDSSVVYKPNKDSYLLEFFAYEQMGPVIPWGYAGLWQDEDQAQADLLAWAAHPESAVDIAYWYYCHADLFYSVRRVKDNFYYDFAVKRFSLLPAHPRAMLPRQSVTVDVPGVLYHTRLSGHLDDGEYVITIRDGDKDIMVGAICLFMKGGAQSATPPVGLEDQPLEEGLPSMLGQVRTRRVRRVDVN